MKKFLDNENREWSLSVTVGDAKRIKAKYGLDLLDHKAVAEIASDPISLVNALWAVCESQAAMRGVTEEDFGRGLAGDAIDYATDALLGAIVDFFPRRQREALKALLARISQANEQAATLAAEKMTGEKMGAAIQAAMTKAEKQIDQMLGELSGSLPG